MSTARATGTHVEGDSGRGSRQQRARVEATAGEARAAAGAERAGMNGQRWELEEWGGELERKHGGDATSVWRPSSPETPEARLTADVTWSR